MRPTLPRLAAFLIRILAPDEWRESIAGDLQEERTRRRARRQPAGAIWAAFAALAALIQLRREYRKAAISRSTRRHIWDPIRYEIRQAIRTLARRPGFALVTLLTLTLGIGASTAMFSVANWLLFRPVPGVTEVDGLVTIRQELTGGRALYPITVSDARALAALPGLSSLTALSAVPLHVAIDGGEPARVDGQIVLSNFFDVLGQRLTAGRGFLPDEDDPGVAQVAVISHRLWREVFGGDANTVGRQITINSHTFTVVGVAARGFHGPDRAGRADVWVPIASFRQSMPSYPANLLTSRIGLFPSLLGRLAPGSHAPQMTAQAEAVRTRLAAGSPSAGRYTRASFTVTPGLDVPVWQREGLRQLFALLLTVVALLLILTSANAANLMLARAHERRAELATRQALGASRARVIRQLVIEGALLAATGGALAIGAAALLGAWIDGLVVAHNIPALPAVELDWRVLACAALLSMVTTMTASLLPALTGSRMDVAASLTASGRGQTAPGRRTRRALTAVQVAVAVVLLSSGLLLIRSLLARYDVPVGFDADHVLAFSVDPGLQAYSETQLVSFYRALLDDIRAQPGVAAAGLAWVEPFRQIGGGNAVKPVGAPDSVSTFTDSNMMSPGFFPALGVRFLAGRDFNAAETFRADPGGGGVLIVNATLARQIFGTTDVVGRPLAMSLYDERVRTIVGVIDDIRTRTLHRPVEPTTYEPFGQSFLPSAATVHVRLAAPAAAVLPRIREAVRRLDPRLPLYDVEALGESLDRHVADQRLLSTTTALFAIVATLVAAIGLYGVLARGVAERGREFGIRTALGASPIAVARLVTREALAVTMAGGVAGLIGAAWLARIMTSRLFGVGALDPLSFGIAIAVTILVALSAATGPARRAARIDVVSELR